MVDSRRIEKIFSRRGEIFVKKLLSPEEYQYWQTLSTPSVNYLAKRWAAKEAFSKACGTGIQGLVQFKRISILKDVRGKPFIRLERDLEDWLTEQCQETAGVHLSLSDELPWVLAFVIIEKNK